MGEKQEGFANEAEGYAASLRQQAAWIEESPAAEMIDADELRAAANFIERQQGIIAPAQSAPRPDLRVLFRHVDEQDWDYLVSLIGDGGRDRFWKTVIADIRGALLVSPAALRAPEAADAGAVAPGVFPYQQTFDAICAAVSLWPCKEAASGISVSVEKFQAAFNSHRDAGTFDQGLASPAADAGMRERERCIRVLSDRHTKLAQSADNPKLTEAQRDTWAAMANEKLDDIRAIRALPLSPEVRTTDVPSTVRATPGSDATMFAPVTEPCGHPDCEFPSCDCEASAHTPHDAKGGAA